MSETDRTIKMVNIHDLVPYINNAKIHNESQLLKLQSSFREFGFINPVIIDKNNNIIAGHGRVEAAKREGIEEVPCIIIDHLTDAQKKAYILADNRLAEYASWDMDLVKVELEQLKELEFDIELTGFDSDIINEAEALDLSEPDSVIKDVKKCFCPKCGFEFEVEQ